VRAPLARRIPLFLALTALAVACGSASSSRSAGTGASTSDDTGVDPPDGGPLADAGALDAAPVRDSAAASQCTATFGAALTSAFGRADGTLLAILTPEDQQCPRPNATHVILEVTMGGSAYRMVVNVQSDTAPFDVAYTELHAPLAGPAWADGWHPGVALDYATTLGLHTDAFAPTPTAGLVSTIVTRLAIGAPVSVYATSSGGDSAHLVHRNATDQDGAIVLDPASSSPTYMLFRFSNQTF
jgi:hypothetical protein